jgi:hypothetical protein
MSHPATRFLAALLAIGCGQDGAGDPVPAPDGGVGVDGGDAIALEFPDIEAVHARSIAPTCSPNGGVCHNSREYPDLHTVSNLLAQIGQPCNMAAPTPADVRDACEPEGDRLVVPSLGIDAEVARITHTPVDVETDLLEEAVFILATPHGVARGRRAPGAELHRGSVAFDVTAEVTVVEATQVRVDLRDVTFYNGALRLFMDDRVYPWQPTMVRVADPNGNGVLGGPGRLSLLTPGSPDDSYLMMRLMDEAEGDLMPRQCRVWNQMATRAVGCWIAGLTVDDDGAVNNAYDPIDYASCTFDPSDLGRCVENDKQVVEEIFGRTCGGSGCHIGEDRPAQGLDLGAEPVRDQLVGVSSREVPDWLRVDPGRPDRSYLYCKLVADCPDRTGNRMPAGGPPLSDTDLEAIRRWIVAGAR